MKVLCLSYPRSAPRRPQDRPPPPRCSGRSKPGPRRRRQVLFASARRQTPRTALRFPLPPRVPCPPQEQHPRTSRPRTWRTSRVGWASWKWRPSQALEEPDEWILRLPQPSRQPRRGAGAIGEPETAGGAKESRSLLQSPSSPPRPRLCAGMTGLGKAREEPLGLF